MPVYSHSKQISKTQREGSKLLIDHLKGVRDKAIAHLSNRTSFGNQENEEILHAICWLHDLGKYTSYFQTYLLNPAKADYQLKSHSNLGAHTAFSNLKSNPDRALLAFYIIKMHHSNLMNFEDVIRPDRENRMRQERIFPMQKAALKSQEELLAYFEFTDDQIALNDPKLLHSHFKKELKKNLTIEHYFETNYLFSLLIEADKLDASDTDPSKPVSINSNAVDNRKGFGKPKYPNGSIKSFSQNELRNFVRSEVVKNIDRQDILDKRIFTLAAPTGIGKTMTALDFVLKLRAKIEQKENYPPQIIYGLPFINIIEQALQEYEKTIGSDVVMGHYQYADVFGKDERSKNELDDEEIRYNQKKMAWDTWQKDVVITSFVQLFETLIGNRNKLLKKFRHFADSIIILDEVQTLAIEKLPVIGAALYYLCKYLNARVLIMTATQPKLFELMTRELSVDMDEAHLKPFNLLERDEEVFACFNRTRIIPLIEEKIESEDFPSVFEDHWHVGKSCLIVVNKVNRSIDVFNLLKDHFEEDQNVELFYLSTNITPIERQRRINRIKERLPKTTCILVSTQVVEAGVDLDFDMGFRDLGPIDSIVQVAGRINRENSEARKGSPLYIVDFGDCQRIYGVATDIQSRKALGNAEIAESGYKSMVETYFDNIADRRMVNFDISKNVFDAMKNLQYAFPASSTKKHATVSDFKIIEESQNGVSVFVELADDGEGTEACEAYQKLLVGDMKKSEFDQNHKRAFNQRIIAVPDYLEKVVDLQKDPVLSDGLLWINRDSEYYYDFNTGFIRSKSKDDMAAMSF
ncbi:MAG: CRISPR-associated helicase Cas3' [Flavobacteriales bacterium]|nr:CRISPR-associated helicase Cas3' [Flavobacteriales bacterium]